MKVQSERKSLVIGLCFLLGSVLVMIKGKDEKKQSFYTAVEDLKKLKPATINL